MHKTNSLALCMVGLLLWSCGSDSEGPEPFQKAEVERLLTSGDSKSWLLINRKVNNEMRLEDCAKDDTLSFFIGDGEDPDTFLISPGQVLCANETADTLSVGSWEITSNGSNNHYAIIFYSKDTTIQAIEKLTSQFLTLSCNQDDTGNQELVVKEYKFAEM